MNYLNDPKQEINKLYKIIDQCNYDYYILGQPSITDYEFDILIKRLNILEKKYPIYKKEISPTNNVFNEIKFLKIKKNMLHKHISPMLSLNSVYTKNDVLEYNNKIEKDFKYKYNYVCELKFDGVAISLIYINGIFNKAITRGNGIYGENITYNLNYMLDIPYKLSNFKKKILL
ncbi:MAG: hypothetical protein IR527_01945 [Bacteroides sp.]|nr:MAG: hypothetical protein IR527_01945 [Bacteroides sp.]